MSSYKPSFRKLERQIKIQEFKSIFIRNFTEALSLTRLRAPLFFPSEKKLNDGLNGESPVFFKPQGMDMEMEIIHSLAKWKRMKLHQYSIPSGKGIYVEMNAIRQKEQLSKYHSFLVDQFDWECSIEESQRTPEFLFKTVEKIYEALKRSEKEFNELNPSLGQKLPEKISIVSTSDLMKLYPDKTNEEREFLYVQDKKAAFIYQIGHKLQDGNPYQLRAFDYDDWNLNGDIVLWDKINQRNLEISSMGIRVNKDSLVKQSELHGKTSKDYGEYHQRILDGTYPLSIGGGIGRSRLYMFFTESKYLAEVQDTEWTDEIKEAMEKEGIETI